MNRIRGLRVSLLFSLGLVPLACGGDDDAATGDDGGAGGSDAGAQTDAGKGGGQNTAGTGGAAGTINHAGGAGAGGHATCTSPHADAKSGLVTCAEGYAHRPLAVACASVDGGSGGGGGGGAKGNEAQPSKCVTDQDCDNGYICLCGDNGGSCRSANCTTDADCGPSLLCASWHDACGETLFSCQTADDQCAGDADCPNGSCEVAADVSRACISDDQCGRPFLIEGVPRVAPVIANADWNEISACAPQVEHLSPAERTVLAEHWTRLGQMEHASIAAFARFSLQLLALGAPPQLVEGCTTALADETAHTRLCFHLASSYAGCTLGPGPLNIEHSLEHSSLLEIVDLVLAEGCIGETQAALTAVEAADAARDPVIRAAYARIAVDEQNHAALAFRFIRWALEQDPAGVSDRISAALRTLPPAFEARGIVEPCLLALRSAQDRAPRSAGRARTSSWQTQSRKTSAPRRA